MTTRRTIILAVIALMLLVFVAASLRVLGRLSGHLPGREVGTIITEVARPTDAPSRPTWGGVKINTEERAELHRRLQQESVAIPYEENDLVAPATEGFAWAVVYDTCQVLEGAPTVTVRGDRLEFDPGRTTDRACEAPNYRVTVFWINWDEVPDTFTVDDVVIKDRQRS
ncbi:hypothetical protein ACQCX2_13875 [Propionibacteriaceae bacterium Y1700]|uniref:hypothetical protein n=1 Tax=Microlunatus sp. Y1700 TaxID=3418487 RepID=UPI003DA79945